MRSIGGPRKPSWDRPGVPVPAVRWLPKGLTVPDRTMRNRRPIPRHFQFSAHQALAARPWLLCRISGPNKNLGKKEGCA
jgi:hypothetical protein